MESWWPMKRLNEYCKANIVALEWLSIYKELNVLIGNAIKSKAISDSVFQDYENLLFKMYKLFENIKVNPGLKDWFIEFVETQITEYAGLESFYLKHYDETKNEAFLDLFLMLQKDIKRHEKELAQ